MKILCFLNVSNRNNMEADSAFIFYNLISKYLCNESELVFIAPCPLSNNNSKFIYKEFGFNKFEVRFSFDWDAIVRIIVGEKPDVIMVNQIEQVANYRAVLQVIGSKAIVVSYAHYIPFVINDSGDILPDPSLNSGDGGNAIRLSFLSGLVASDIIFTHSFTSKHMLEVFLEKFDRNDKIKNIIINPPPYDPYLIDDNYEPEKKVFYNHRLYKHYGTERFMELSNQLIKNLGVTVHVLDALGNRTSQQRALDDSVDLARNRILGTPNMVLHTDTNNRAAYKKAMKKSLFSIAPYRVNCIWAMACIDSMSMGVPIIAPKIAWFSEIIDRELQYETTEEAIMIGRRLLNDRSYWQQCSDAVKIKASEFSPQRTALVFLNAFEKAITNEG